MTRPSGVAEGWGFGVARAPVTHEIDGNALALDEPTNSLEIVARGGGEDRRGGERHRANSQSADIRRPMAARKSERRVTTQRQRSFCEARGGNGDRGQRARSESNEGSRWGVEESRMRHARVGEGRGTRVRPRGAEIRARPPSVSGKSDANVEPDRRQDAPNQRVAFGSGTTARRPPRGPSRRYERAGRSKTRLARRVAHPRATRRRRDDAAPRGARRVLTPFSRRADGATRRSTGTRSVGRARR